MFCCMITCGHYKAKKAFFVVYDQLQKATHFEIPSINLARKKIVEIQINFDYIFF
jgi:hypothetical protein